jgi:hypothetical protein
MGDASDVESGAPRSSSMEDAATSTQFVSSSGGAPLVPSCAWIAPQEPRSRLDVAANVATPATSRVRTGYVEFRSDIGRTR